MGWLFRPNTSRQIIVDDLVRFDDGSLYRVTRNQIKAVEHPPEIEANQMCVMSTRQDGISDLLIHERRKAAIKHQAMIDKENEVLKARLAQINSATVELTTVRLLCS